MYKALLVHVKQAYIDICSGDKMRQNMNVKWNMPGCISAIDGGHISILKLVGAQNDYRNRKGFHSIILCLMDVDIDFFGKAHDARVYRTSTLFAKAQAHSRLTGLDIKVYEHTVTVRPYIIGDPTYPHNPSQAY